MLEDDGDCCSIHSPIEREFLLDRKTLSFVLSTMVEFPCREVG
jgi:hypothetical protein